jgi:hypothetical protein
LLATYPVFCLFSGLFWKHRRLLCVCINQNTRSIEKMVGGRGSWVEPLEPFLSSAKIAASCCSSFFLCLSVSCLLSFVSCLCLLSLCCYISFCCLCALSLSCCLYIYREGEVTLFAVSVSSVPCDRVRCGDEFPFLDFSDNSEELNFFEYSNSLSSFSINTFT